MAHTGEPGATVPGANEAPVEGRAATAWLDEHTKQRGAQAVFVLLTIVYMVSGPFSGVHRANIDTNASAVTAQRIVTHGSIDVTAFREVTPWIVPSDDRYVSNRPPGTTVFGLPFYLIMKPALSDSQPQHGPSLAAATIVTAWAMAILYLVMREVTTPRVAFLSAIVAGLGTPTWAFSGLALWPHGPDQLLLATAMLVIVGQRRSWLLVAVGALGILTRPLMVIPLFVIGLWLLARRRGPEAVLLAVGSVAGIVGLVTWDSVLFGEGVSLGPYGGSFADNVVELTVGTYLTRFGGTLFDPLNGILFVTPVIAIAVALAFRNGRQVWPEAWMFAAAGVVYILVHLGFNRFNPGFRVNYRYPIETVTLMAPLAAVGVARTLSSKRTRILVTTAVIWGIGFQALDVFGLENYIGQSPSWLPWTANP